MRTDVCSAVSQTVPTTRNQICVGRADGASNCEYAPKKLDRQHTRASAALRTVISEVCSLTLFVNAEGWTRMRLRDCTREHPTSTTTHDPRPGRRACA